MDGSALNWSEQHTLRELMSEDLLFAKLSEPEIIVINFDMGEWDYNRAWEK